METLSEALARLAAEGYREEFRAERDGLRALEAGCVHAPEELVIEETVRFEGTSDPSDEAVLFALRCTAHGTRGTYVVAYGPDTDARDAAMVQRLGEGRRR